MTMHFEPLHIIHAEPQIDDALVLTAGALVERHMEAVVPRLSAEILDSLPVSFLLADAKGHLRQWNRRFQELSGYADDELRARLLPELLLCATALKVENLPAEATLVHRAGHHLLVLLDGTERCDGLKSAPDSRWLFLGIVDLAVQRRIERKLQRLAYSDSLTRLPSRYRFLERLNDVIRRTRNASGAFAVLLIDLDRFALINESLGHAIGDRVLRALAQRLRIEMSEQDDLARFGEDEFVLLLPGPLDSSQVIALAKRLQDVLAKSVTVGQHQVRCTASVGVVLSDVRLESAADYLRDADTAVFRAKAQGRARVVCFDPRMRQRSQQRLELEGCLRRAFEAGEFEVYLQPIVALASGSVSCFEALLRWQRPGGLSTPESFIAVAEESELIVMLDQWVLRRCAELLVTPEGQAQALRIYANVSARTLQDFDLPGLLRALCAQYGFAAERLGIEITESALLEDLETIHQTLDRLVSDGHRVVLDDFGTGYSSLTHLRRFPISAIKIDRSFTAQLEQDGRERIIVRSLIDLVHALGLTVTAEGIETEAQRVALLALGCHHGQGYLLGRPQPAAVPSTLTSEARA